MKHNTRAHSSTTLARNNCSFDHACLFVRLSVVDWVSGWGRGEKEERVKGGHLLTTSIFVRAASDNRDGGDRRVLRHLATQSARTACHRSNASFQRRVRYARVYPSDRKHGLVADKETRSKSVGPLREEEVCSSCTQPSRWHAIPREVNSIDNCD
jgi:hypothetical protein